MERIMNEESEWETDVVAELVERFTREKIVEGKATGSREEIQLKVMMDLC